MTGLRQALWGTVLLAALAACVPAPPPTVTPVVDPEALRRGLAALPGARVSGGEPVSAAYPGEVLFARGAALPLPGGTTLLDPLASFLLAHPETNWVVSLRADTGISPDYDLLLAEGRRALLERYFRNKGLSPPRLVLEVGEGAGAPLTLTLVAPLQPTSPESSPGEKR